MKILVHQPRLSYYLGGGETVPLEQVAFLCKLGHDVEILTSKPPKFSNVFEEFRKQNPRIKIHFLELGEKDKNIYEEEPGKDWSRWDKEAILFGQKASKFYFDNSGKWDIVVTHLLSDSHFIPSDFLNVLHLHGVPSEKRSFDKILLNRPNAFIAVSKFVKDGWISLYPLLKKKDIKVCYNGLDTTKFLDKGESRNIDLLYVGRFLKSKGIYEIVEAINNLNSRKIFNKIMFIGKGPELEGIKSKIKKYGLKNKTTFKVDVSSSVLIAYYNHSKIFLCPSYAKEGVLTTMLEAASCGSALITANCCGMIEFAKHEHNALLSTPQDCRDLASKITDLLSNEKLRTNLVLNAKEDLSNHWSLEKTMGKLEKEYYKIIGRYK